MQVGNTTAYVNGVAKTLDVSAHTIEGRTMAPARFIAESLNTIVNWDGASDTVKISISASTQATPFDHNLNSVEYKQDRLCDQD